jgi:heme/copper-type cytochrome/quinol oxidase subunit 4
MWRLSAKITGMHKHTRSWFLAWVVGILLTAIAIAYIARNTQSIDAAVVEIFGTLIGTMVGVAAGLYYDRTNKVSKRMSIWLFLNQFCAKNWSTTARRSSS